MDSYFYKMITNKLIEFKKYFYDYSNLIDIKTLKFKK
jgi:hypothetical protein